MIKSLSKTKKGAASFYIVAFSTLILVIIAASFATAVINEITRTSNDDLSQSAYDSALAGIEDAKLAFLNYQRCQKITKDEAKPNGDNTVTCQEINYWMNPNHADCYMVGHILGRIKETVEYGEGDPVEVLVSDTITNVNGSSVSNNLKQAYTCAEINTSLNDYRATLSSSNNSKVVKVDLAGGPSMANAIVGARIKWFSRSEQIDELNFSNIVENPSLKLGGNKTLNWRVAFQPVSSIKAAVPPVISVEMVQTAPTFNLDDFTKVVRRAESGPTNKTNRAAFVMVPTDSLYRADSSKYSGDKCEFCDVNNQWWGAYDVEKSENYFPSKWFVNSNLAGTGRGGKNYPYLVYCDDNSTSEFLCEAWLDLPAPYDSSNPESTEISRNSDTFMFVISLPYGQPDTEFALEFYCADGQNCSTQNISLGGGTDSSQAQLTGVQINIDSTGRANDLFRRVETRLESADAGFVYPLYGIQLLGDDNSTLLDKNKDGVVTEHSFGSYEEYLNNLNSRLIGS